MTLRCPNVALREARARCGPRNPSIPETEDCKRDPVPSRSWQPSAPHPHGIHAPNARSGLGFQVHLAANPPGHQVARARVSGISGIGAGSRAAKQSSKPGPVVVVAAAAVVPLFRRKRQKRNSPLRPCLHSCVTLGLGDGSLRFAILRRANASSLSYLW